MPTSTTFIATAPAATVALAAPAAAFTSEDMTTDPKGVEMVSSAPQTGYAPVNGLHT